MTIRIDGLLHIFQTSTREGAVAVIAVGRAAVGVCDAGVGLEPRGGLGRCQGGDLVGWEEGTGRG
jgi:hypothetical protein